MTMIPSATELLRAWDATRPRSLQTELGMSSLGSCRRQAGYHLQGYEPDEDFEGDSGMQAILGTAIHAAFAQAADSSPLIPEGAIIENKTVHFAGLTGHPDLYVEPVLRDVKTVGFQAQLERLRLHGPLVRHLWQAACYGAALILEGYPVMTLQLDYLSRDTGDEFLWEGPFDMQYVRDAISWLSQSRTTPVTRLARDFRPESAQCGSCPFSGQCWGATAVPGRSLRTALFADDPNARDWVMKMEAARAARKQAEQQEDDAKGALDALRTVTRPGETEDIVIPGMEKVLRFSVSRGRSHLDRDRINADYERAGAQPPVRYGQPVVSVSVALPRKPKKNARQNRGDSE